MTMHDDDDAVVSEAAPPQAAGLTQGQRLVNTFVAPSRTFTDILRNHSWWLPFLIMAVVSYAYLFTLENQVGWDTVANNITLHKGSFAANAEDQSPERMQRVHSITVAIVKSTMYAYPLIILAVTAIAALALSGTINLLFKGSATFEKTFAVWTYGMLPRLLSALLPTIGLFAGLDKSAFYLSNPIGTNLGYYLGAQTPAWLMTIASSIDVLQIWALALVGIGLSIVANVRRSAGLVTVFGWAIACVLAKVVYASI